ncbi:MAG: thiamine phosphate synthase [Deltaproteobacteria bacterium]|nr:thiamine phosphate synthase [Deltaproteobacteria bacterium]
MTDRRAAGLGSAPGDFVALAGRVAAAVAGGADQVQLREKDLDGAALLELARAVGAAARRAHRDVTLLLNRRMDVALAAGWDGVHLGFDGAPVAQARALLGPRARIGVATHTPGELAALSRAPAAARPDQAQLAPIWPPLSKAARGGERGEPARGGAATRSEGAARGPLGLEALARAAACGIPLLAQGGVTAARAADCIRAGAAGIAATGALLGAKDPQRAAAELRAALDSARA